MSKRIMGVGVRVWDSLGAWMYRRPFQMLGILFGSAIVISLLAYSSATSFTNENDISRIKNMFCSGTGQFTELEKRNCDRLLDRLLLDPTPEQKERLRIIVKEAS